MNANSQKAEFKTIDEYISTFPKETQDILQKVREIFKDQITNATEGISYQIPTIFVNGKYFLYFAGYEKYIAIYPIHPDQFPFAKKLEEYQSGKATLKFPLDQEMPYDLVEKIVKCKVESQK